LQVKLPADPLIVARASGSLRSRRIKPLKITRENHGFRVQMFSKKSLPPEPQPESSPDLLASLKLDEPSDTGEEKPKTLAEKLRLMPVTERAALAMKADLQERRILMQESNPKIHEFLLRNPRLTEGEIAFMARNPMSPIQTILTILQHRNWMTTDSIRQGILTNPKTPAVTVLDMIPALSAGDLIKMYHARMLREDVRASVQREVKKRGIRIRKENE